MIKKTHNSLLFSLNDVSYYDESSSSFLIKNIDLKVDSGTINFVYSLNSREKTGFIRILDKQLKPTKGEFIHCVCNGMLHKNCNVTSSSFLESSFFPDLPLLDNLCLGKQIYNFFGRRHFIKKAEALYHEFGSKPNWKSLSTNSRLKNNWSHLWCVDFYLMPHFIYLRIPLTNYQHQSMTPSMPSV